MAELDPTLSLLQAQAHSGPATAPSQAVDPTLAMLEAHASGESTPASAQPGMLGTAVDTVNRQLQLAGRAGVEGMMSLGSLPQTAVTAVANGSRALGDHLLGIPQSSPDMEYPSAINSRTLDAVGMPHPSNAGERVESDVLSALSGARGMQQAGQAMGGKWGALLSASPDVQNATAMTGALAGGAARENGASPTAQLAYSLLGGAAGGGLYSATKAAALPLTKAGQSQIVGQALIGQANDPEAAMQSLSSVPQYVPGSNPTGGIASKDYGLMGAEKYAKASAPGLYADASSLQNKARNDFLDTFASGDIQAMKDARNAQTTPLRDAAFAKAGQADITPVQELINQTVLGPDGNQIIVQKSLGDLQNSLAGETDPARLYGARKDMGLMMGGKLNKDGYQYDLAKSQIMPVRDELDAAIDKAAPGFRDYLDQHRQLSIPINQAETAQGVRSNITTTNIDPTTGLPFLSQPRMTGILQDGTIKTPVGVQALADALAPDQLQGFQNLGSDLERANALNSTAIRQPGSDTFSNMAMGNNLATKLASKTPFVGKFLGYSGANDAIKQKLIEALLSPEQTRSYMQAGKKASDSSASNAIRALLAKP